MRPPKNFDNKLNRRKQLLPEVPQATAEDAGKIVKVGESGYYELGDDENTIIIPNPDGVPSAMLNSLAIGSTIYKVNNTRVSKLLGLRFTINNGGTYNAKMPLVSFVNEYGEAAQVPTYTMTCDKPVQYGASNLNGSAGVLTENLPAVFTILFNAEFNIENFANIKLENGGLFPGDIAKNIKLEYSVNGTDWLEIFDKVSIDWTNTIHIYDMSTGEEITKDLTGNIIFSPTTPLLPNSSQAIDFDINDFDKYKTMAVYHRHTSDSEQMSCWFVPVSYIKYCLDNNLYMALTGFGNRYILFKFAVVDDVPTIITSNGSDDAIYMIILYK